MDREKIQSLRELSDLLEEGRLTQVEFNTLKKLILKPQNQFFSLLQSIGLFFKYISPQLIVLILIILFYKPVNNLILNASEVGFGDVFAVKVEQALRLADPRLADNLKGLTEEELIVLMSAGSRYFSMAYVDKEDSLLHLNSYYPYYQSLYSKKLMQARTDAEEIFEILNSKSIVEVEDEILPGDSLITDARTVYYSLEDFTEEELEKVRDLSFGLSPQGEDALRVIIRVASEEISTLN